MNISKNKAKVIIQSIVMLILAAGALSLSLWIGDSMAILFDSVLDKYLNYTESMLYLAACSINRIFFIIFLILFIISIIKLIKNKDLKKNIIRKFIILLFVITNIIFLVLLISLQFNENKTVDAIYVKSYVNIHEIFDIDDNDDSYRELTIYRKINTDIPVNYEVQQTTSECSVHTSCIEIIDSQLLSKYYEEQKSKYIQYKYIDFSESQLKETSVDKGCLGIENDNSIIILVIKSNKFYKVFINGEDIPDQNQILKQIELL